MTRSDEANRPDKRVTRMMEIQHLLRGAETDAEKVSAIVRLVVFVTLTTAIVSSDATRDLTSSIGVVMAVYGVGAIIGLALAW